MQTVQVSNDMKGVALAAVDQVIHRHTQRMCDTRNEVRGDSLVDSVDEIAETCAVPANLFCQTGLCERATWITEHTADPFGYTIVKHAFFVANPSHKGSIRRETVIECVGNRLRWIPCLPFAGPGLNLSN